MFIIVKTWSNWDAIHERIVGAFSSQDEAQKEADRMQSKAMGSAYLVRPESKGASNTYFPRAGR